MTINYPCLGQTQSAPSYYRSQFRISIFNFRFTHRVKIYELRNSLTCSRLPSSMRDSCAVQCSAVQCSAVQCIEVQCSAVQCSDPSLGTSIITPLI